MATNATTFESFRIEQDHTMPQLIDIAKQLKARAMQARSDASARFDDTADAFGEGMAELDLEYKKLDKEAKRLEELYQAIKAKLFLNCPSVAPGTDEALQDKVDHARLVYDRLDIALAQARDFHASVKDALAPNEAVRDARHIALLELRELHAWCAYQSVLKEVDAKPTRLARINAAETLLQAEQSIEKFYRHGGKPGEIVAAQEKLDDAIRCWIDTSKALRDLRERADAQLSNASQAQMICSGELYNWFEAGADNAEAVRNAKAQGVDITFHLALWSKALRSNAVPEVSDSMPEKPVAARTSPMRREHSDSWSVIGRDSDATINSEASVHSRASMLSCAAASKSFFQSVSTDARPSLRVQTDSSGDDSDISFAPARRNASTPTSERGDATLGSLASVMPLNEATLVQGAASGGEARSASFDNTLGSLSSAMHLNAGLDASDDSDVTVSFGTTMQSRPKSRHYAYVPQSGRAPPPLQSQCLARPEEFGDSTLGSIASVLPHGMATQGLMRSLPMHIPRAASLLPSQPGTSADANAMPPKPLDIKWENCTVWLSPVREALSQGNIMHFVEGLPLGGRVAATRCHIGQSNKYRRGPAFDALPDEFFACVTLETRDQAIRCIAYINQAKRDFGMTPLGTNKAMRMLNAEECKNNHLNGYDDARHEAELRQWRN